MLLLGGPRKKDQFTSEITNIDTHRKDHSTFQDVMICHVWVLMLVADQYVCGHHPADVNRTKNSSIR